MAAPVGMTRPRRRTAPTWICAPSHLTRPRRGGAAMRASRWQERDADLEVDGDVGAVMYEIGTRHQSTSDRVRTVTEAELHPPDGAIPEQRARAAYRERVAQRGRARGQR